MKKLFLIAVLFSMLTLVGCGNKAAPTDDAAVAPTDGNTVNTVAQGEQKEAAPTVDVAKTEKLAACLTEKKVTMYGTEWCGHCKNQKELFGAGFAKATFVDCDAERQKCLDAGVRGFPTWIDAQGNQYPGTQQLDKLAQIAGCEM